MTSYLLSKRLVNQHLQVLCRRRMNTMTTFSAMERIALLPTREFLQTPRPNMLLHCQAGHNSRDNHALWYMMSKRAPMAGRGG